MAITEAAVNLEPIQRLRKDLRSAAATLQQEEVRFLVDYYYTVQEDRIRSAHLVRTLSESREPHSVLQWVGDNAAVFERNIKSALDAYTDSILIGKWAKSITGIGPVLAAGLSAHIQIEKAPTVGHIWRFAGLDPTSVWSKGQKRPWNARLKTLCWKIGESFVKVSGNPNDVYGKLWRTRKEYEQQKNEAGEYASQAAIRKEKVRDSTEAHKWYAEGKLPPGHVHERSKRWAVKLFLSHWHMVAYYDKFGQMAPKPYVHAILGHVDEIQVPNWPWGPMSISGNGHTAEGTDS